MSKLRFTGCSLCLLMVTGIVLAANNDSYFRSKTAAGTTWNTYTALSSTPWDENSTMVATNDLYDPLYIMAVFRDNRGGDYDWYYTESTDGGVTWTTPAIAVDTDYDVQVTWNAQSLVVDHNGYSHLVWARYEQNLPRLNQTSGVYYARYDYTTSTWLPTVTIKEVVNTQDFYAPPSIAIYDHCYPHVAWGAQTEPSHDSGQLWYARSTDCGVTFSNPVDINTDPGMDTAPVPSICAAGAGDLYVAFGPDWFDSALLGEIYFRHSANDGVSWGGQTVIANDAGSDGYPSLTCTDNGKVFMVYKGSEDDKHDYKNIRYKHSNDRGATWTPAGGGIQLSTNFTRCAYVYSAYDREEGEIHILYDDRLATLVREAFYMRIDEAGNILNPAAQATPNLGNSVAQYISFGNGQVNIGVDEYLAPNQVWDVSCEHTLSGGDLNHYQYRVRNVSGGSDTLTRYCIGTEDPVLASYTIQPTTGFTAGIYANDGSVLNDFLYTNETETAHGTVPPEATTPSGALLCWNGNRSVSSGGTVTFSFDHASVPVDLEWQSDSGAGWSAAKSTDPVAGPSGTYTFGYVHGPGSCDDGEPCTVDEYSGGTCVNTPLTDTDSDGVCDLVDNCPDHYNPEQEDTDDIDGVGNACDNCGYDWNPSQSDCDEDGTGDACDADTVDLDEDAVDDTCDNCPDLSNPYQLDDDSDGIGNQCDSCPDDSSNDTDDDGYCAGSGYSSPKVGDQDNCPTDFNPSQSDCDSDGSGDACDPDLADPDSDGVDDPCDNCASDWNPRQSDCDGDIIGDVCDPDTVDVDGDRIDDACDNCPGGYNPDQGLAIFGQDVGGRGYCDFDESVTCVSDADCSIGSCSKGLYEWSISVGYVYAKGDFTGSGDIGAYDCTFSQSGVGTYFTDSDDPDPGAGFWYLVQPDCPSASWQTEVGAEPQRDGSMACP